MRQLRVIGEEGENTMRKNIVGAVVVALALAFAAACEKASTPTSPSGPVQTIPNAPTPTPGSIWSTFGQLELRGSTTVGSYVQVWIGFFAPRPLCHVYVRKVKDPNGVSSEFRSARLCGTSTHGSFMTDFRIDIPGRYEVSLLIYESAPDSGAMSPEAPVIREAEIMGR